MFPIPAPSLKEAARGGFGALHCFPLTWKVCSVCCMGAVSCGAAGRTCAPAWSTAQSEPREVNAEWGGKRPPGRPLWEKVKASPLSWYFPQEPQHPEVQVIQGGRGSSTEDLQSRVQTSVEQNVIRGSR